MVNDENHKQMMFHFRLYDRLSVVNQTIMPSFITHIDNDYFTIN